MKQNINKNNLLFLLLLFTDFSLWFLPFLNLTLNKFGVIDSKDEAWVMTLGWIFTAIFFIVNIFNIVEMFFPKIKWYWLIPGYLFLPLSVPYLIINNKKSKDNKEEENKFNFRTKEGLFIATSVIDILSLIDLVLFFFILYIASLNSTQHMIIVITFSIVNGLLFVGLLFNILNYFIPKKIFKILAWCGPVFNWFYLLWLILEEKKQKQFTNNDDFIPKNN